MADAMQVVREFCAAWESMDQQRILDGFTDDAIYHNMPMAPAQGKDAINGLLGFILGAGEQREVRDQAHGGGRRRRADGAPRHVPDGRQDGRAGGDGGRSKCATARSPRGATISIWRHGRSRQADSSPRPSRGSGRIDGCRRTARASPMAHRAVCPTRWIAPRIGSRPARRQRRTPHEDERPADPQRVRPYQRDPRPHGDDREQGRSSRTRTCSGRGALTPASPRVTSRSRTACARTSSAK